MSKFSKLFLIVFVLLAFSSCDKDSEVAGEIQDSSEIQQSQLITLESGVIVEKRGDEYIWEGDISLSKVQLEALDKKGTLLEEKPEYIGPNKEIHPAYNIPMNGTPGQEAVSKSFSIYPTSYNLWAMVRFTFDSNLPTSMRQTLSDALHEMESMSNVRFYNATGKPTSDPVYGFDYPYIEFTYVGPEDVSSSKLGRVGGKQQIKLADFATFDRGVIIHETCHALGMRHEQTRTDRNSFVTVNTSNLTSSGLAQFQIPSTNYYQQGTYDFNSVMGYSSFTSSSSIVNNTSQPMYTRLNGSSIIQGNTISAEDRRWLNRFYIPYIARSDVYAELAAVVYKPDNTVMTAAERLSFQAQLNNGNSTPPNKYCKLRLSYSYKKFHLNNKNFPY